MEQNRYKKDWYLIFPFCLKFLVILGSLFPSFESVAYLIIYRKKLSPLDTAHFRMKCQSFDSIDQPPSYFCNV
jgi:hypothetical protein